MTVGAFSFDELTERLREVEADFVNPFLSALYHTLISMGHTTASKGSISLIKANTLDGDTIVFLKVNGAVKGLVILELPDAVAKKFVSLFLFGLPIAEMDDMARNSLNEFSLRVSETARTQLVKKGYHANVSSHVMYHKPLQFSRDRQFIVVPLNTEYGEFKVFFNVMKSDVLERTATTH